METALEKIVKLLPYERDGLRYMHFVPLWLYIMSRTSAEYRDAVVCVRQYGVLLSGEMPIFFDPPALARENFGIKQGQKTLQRNGKSTNPDTMLLCRVASMGANGHVRAKWFMLHSLVIVTLPRELCHKPLEDHVTPLTQAQVNSLPELYRSLVPDELLLSWDQFPQAIMSDAAHEWFQT